MILTELPGQQGSPIGCGCCAPCWKIVEMVVERGLEMTMVVERGFEMTMESGLATISSYLEW